ncbi:helix-turn-helix transcriptional regulator [Sutcliffiella cohnii]|uniref:helix-turn-helix transcriptional regulator n=1 Tax=Sutcliffiella cohnii TaxID=33932 RepID=UPI002E22E0EA|nr:helix-turn-helix transcriptional regulator [Sutcliffiella cohnii]
MKVVNRIGTQIEKSGYRDDYIAGKLGVSKKQVWNWRKGYSFPTFEKAFLLAKILSCKVDDLGMLIEDEEQKNLPQ